jgi:hypothetical protein
VHQTVQECILPAKGVLLYGPVSIDLDFLIKAFDSLSQHMLADCCSSHFSQTSHTTTKWIRKLGSDLCDIEIMREGRQSGTRIGLWDALIRFRKRFATDDRDKIFGVLGMITSWPSVPVVPDYRISAEALYLQIVTSEIIERKSLHPLHFPLQKHKFPKLSSWAVDWTAASELADQLNTYQFTQDLFLVFKLSREPCHAELIDGSLLQVKGRRCDKVVSVGPECRQSGVYASAKEQRQIYCDWFRNLSLHENPTREYTSGGTHFEAFWRCLCWDIVLRITEEGQALYSRKETNQTYESFVAWCQNSTRSILHPQGLSESDRKLIVELDARFEMEAEHKWNIHSPTSFLTQQLINGITVNTTMFKTESGYIGIGPAGIEAGDEIWCLFGGRMPFVLRQTPRSRDKESLWQNLGICYTHGIMAGEISDNAELPIGTLLLA